MIVENASALSFWKYVLFSAIVEDVDGYGESSPSYQMYTTTLTWKFRTVDVWLHLKIVGMLNYV